MGLATIGILALLFWRAFVVHEPDAWESVLWFLMPDLVAFIPIGLASRGDPAWPTWGARLYNVPHSFLPWAGVFVGWYLLSGALPWPLLGWALHITLDRTAGYSLRAT